MLRRYAHRHGSILRQPAFWVDAAWGAAVLTLGMTSMLVMKQAMLSIQGDFFRPSYDLLLDLFATRSTHGVVVWGPAVVAALAVWRLAVTPAYIPFTFKTVGLLYLIRAFFIVLTPAGSRADQITTAMQGFMSGISYSGNDFFFSGHVAFPFVFALIFWRQPVLRAIFLAAAAILGVGVIMEHVHYSIDVFAVPPIVWSVWSASVVIFKHDLRYIETYEKHLAEEATADGRVPSFIRHSAPERAAEAARL